MTTIARMKAAVGVSALVWFLTACGTAGEGGTGGTANSINGALLGYPYVGSATVQAFAPEGNSQLVGGSLYPVPNARVEASLTPPANVPASAYVQPLFCAGVSVSPTSTRTTAVFVLGVSDSGGPFGLLLRSSFNTNTSAPQVGDKLFVYLLSNTTATVRGNCVQDGLSYSYDINLSNGWTAVAAQVTSLDSFGNPSGVAYTADNQASSAPWFFTEVAFALGNGTNANALRDTTSAVTHRILGGIGY